MVLPTHPYPSDGKWLLGLRRRGGGGEQRHINLKLWGCPGPWLTLTPHTLPPSRCCGHPSGLWAAVPCQQRGPREG